jgi:hypothetical protein
MYVTFASQILSVKCMYVTFASQILSVKFHVQLSVLFGFYVFWNSIVQSDFGNLLLLVLEVWCFWSSMFSVWVMCFFEVKLYVSCSNVGCLCFMCFV